MSRQSIIFKYEDGHPVHCQVKDPEIQFSDKAVRKMMNDYALNPDNRFSPIYMDVLVPGDKPNEFLTKKIGLHMKGKIIPGGIKTEITEEFNRPMTITDVLYLACVDVCEKRHVYISRYPVGTDKGLIFTCVNVRSTIDTVHLIFNDKEYRFYPKIDVKMNHAKVGTQFLDTITYAEAHLAGMGGLH